MVTKSSRTGVVLLVCMAGLAAPALGLGIRDFPGGR
jgi:hypothetical protein